MTPTLSVTTSGRRHSNRRGEPVTFGVALPRRWCSDDRLLSLCAADGTEMPLQAKTLDAWPDGSIRWVLIDSRVDVPAGDVGKYVLGTIPEPRVPAGTLSVRLTEDGASIRTGVAQFAVGRDGQLTLCGGSVDAPTDVVIGGARITDRHGSPLAYHVERVTQEITGDVRSVILVEGTVAGPARRVLRLTIRYHFVVATTTVRVEVTLRNTSRAVHDGGFWELGDPGSMMLREFSYAMVMPGDIEPVSVTCSAEVGRPCQPIRGPFELYQDSSGGEHWQSSNHVTHEGRVSTTFRGYRVRGHGVEQQGLRATPVVTVRRGDCRIAVAHRQFWERFPKAIEVTDRGVSLGLLPHQCAELHELQGGEQVTEEFVICFDDDGVSDVPLDWVRNPLRASADVDWYAAAEAMPYFCGRDTSADSGQGKLVEAAIDGPDAFATRRERIDEYGWRHYGDLYADHEAVHHEGSHPLISHYNNQYDAIAGFARQFLRSGDLRWFSLMSDLARHVIDIDIYHTREDKAAYNGGLFWHTAHHTDAGRATHRTYPRTGSGASGGPSAEHDYSTGLMMYYFLSGDSRAREAVLELAQWVIDMDDGARTPFRWLSRSRTGLASATGSPDYHGPGRGPGNSIVTLLNAFRLSGSRDHLRKVDELIRRCAHPSTDIPGLNLLDAERRWFYTVFLQSLGHYLDVKVHAGQLDEMYGYARATLLHFARWMAEHEYPYLEKPEILEFPTETWAAQDVRKSDVFCYAAKHAEGAERARFLERAEFFFTSSVASVSRFETRTLTRPVVLMLTNGHALGYLRTHDVRAPVPPDIEFGSPAAFVPQKVIALRRLMAVAGTVAVVSAGALFAYFWLT